MIVNREDRRQLLQTMAKLSDGLEKLNSVYLNALKGRPARIGMSRGNIEAELIEEILRLEFDEAERP